MDGYLLTLTPDRRSPLEHLRKAMRRLLPDAQECISYGMPAFRVPGGVVGGFAATQEGYSYYPFSGQTLSELAEEVSAYPRTKSALHFTAKRPLPASLLRKLVDARLAEIERKRGPKKEIRSAHRKRIQEGSRRPARPG
jgi:uncharacterized protein YdhG (YjbR/CyaY superfamily)